MSPAERAWCYFVVFRGAMALALVVAICAALIDALLQ